MSLQTNILKAFRRCYPLRMVRWKKLYSCPRSYPSYFAATHRRTLSPELSVHENVTISRCQSKNVTLCSTLIHVLGRRHYSQKSIKFTLKDDTYRDYLNHLEQEWRDLEEQKTSGKALGHEKAQRWVVLNRVVEINHKLKVKYEELKELSLMLNDDEIKDIAVEENKNCLAEIEELENDLVDMICPVEKYDDCDIIMEIESGAGGQEAMLFAQEIFKMYENYAIYKGWQFNPTQINEDPAGGYRKAAATVSGQGVYGLMKYESGVHRVQRVPKTESKGRIHTSTIAVCILPQPSEIEVTLNPKDLQIETFRSSGPGGQNAQVTDSAVRVRHIPTGIKAEIQTTRSQFKNKELALAVVRTRIYEKQLNEQRQEITSKRKMQIGNKDRSEKIRTYNFQQDRITDHRLSYNVHNISLFLEEGMKLDNLIQDLVEEANKENLLALLEEFEQSTAKQKAQK